MDALNTAKSLPDLAAKIEALGNTVTRVKDGLQDLEEKLPDSEVWTAKLENLKTLATDLQRTLDQLPIGDSSTATQTATSTKAADAREEIGKTWVAIKDHVEGLIDSLHGNRRNTYASITRYRYDEITDMLLQDGKISQTQKNALMEANARFLSLRNRRLEIAPDDLAKFKKWQATIEDS